MKNEKRKPVIEYHLTRHYRGQREEWYVVKTIDGFQDRAWSDPQARRVIGAAKRRGAIIHQGHIWHDRR